MHLIVPVTTGVLGGFGDFFAVGGQASPHLWSAAAAAEGLSPTPQWPQWARAAPATRVRNEHQGEESFHYRSPKRYLLFSL